MIYEMKYDKKVMSIHRYTNNENINSKTQIQ